MSDIYWALAIALFGAILPLFKDWKKKDSDGYVKNNMIGVISFLLIFFGSIKACSTNMDSLKAKIKSDSLANSRQDTIIELTKLSNRSLKSQLDTTITILNYSKKLNEAQSKLYKQNERLLNPLEKIQLKYVLQIPGSQKVFQEYKKRILAQDPCPRCASINLFAPELMPNQNLPGENLFAWFLMDIFASIKLGESSSDIYGRPDFSMTSSASTSIEEMAKRKTDSSEADKIKSRINLVYFKKNDSFFLEVSDPDPFQRHSINILSFKDFPGKEVQFEVAIGFMLESQTTRDDMKKIRSIDFKILDLYLYAETYGRKISITNFIRVRTPMQNDGKTSFFKSKV